MTACPRQNVLVVSAVVPLKVFLWGAVLLKKYSAESTRARSALAQFVFLALDGVARLVADHAENLQSITPSVLVASTAAIGGSA
jgi:hypothetical protein